MKKATGVTLDLDAMERDARARVKQTIDLYAQAASTYIKLQAARARLSDTLFQVQARTIGSAPPFPHPPYGTQ